MCPTQSGLIDQIISIIPTSVINITTIPLIFMKNNLQTTSCRWKKTLTVATIQRRVANLSSILSLTKNANPTKEPVVILTFKKLRRKFRRPQKKAPPLTYDILKKLKNVCSDDIVGLRNRLLLQLGYKTMRRRSEICQFKFEDL